MTETTTRRNRGTPINSATDRQLLYAVKNKKIASDDRMREILARHSLTKKDRRVLLGALRSAGIDNV